MTPATTPESRSSSPVLRVEGQPRRTGFRRGPMLMVGASLLFTVMVALVKEARRELSVLDVLWWRAATSVPLGFFVARASGFRVRRMGLFGLRVVLGFSAMSCFFMAAAGPPLTDLVLIGKLQPLLIAFAAPMLLGIGERVSGRAWLAIGAGFVGCTLLVIQDLHGGSWFALWAVAGTGFSALAHLAVRRLGATEGPLALVFWFQTAALVISTALLGVVEGRLVPAAPGELLPILIGIGIVATGGQCLMTWAYKLDRAALVAAASYSAPLFAVIIDVALAGAWPSVSAILGGALIIGSGIVIVGGRPAPT